ncbi:phospholipase A and acyltransferase 4-like [Toxotes jaculatrix]|uniref:phospholipase A and acyltransferase 4-like n=1 Tax=Toxotes jaculatrix TaxID=941984 RepID=UPI001B3A9976|nr:phospholipase A and acyltransferase 4-like [Toxotes jaculatrix]
MEPQPGDLIEIFRVGFQHWAVYVGDGYVVHLVNPDGFSSSSGSQSIHPRWVCRAQVMKQKLKDVVKRDKWHINNKLDTTYRPRPIQQIVKEALSLVGEKVLYCVFLRNCEHFATELRYGKAMSWQVIKVAVGVAAVAAGSEMIIAGSAVTAAAACIAFHVALSVSKKVGMTKLSRQWEL